MNIEAKSMSIIREELGDKVLPKGYESIIYRVIHTSADFGYADRLCFSEGARESALEALKKGAHIITDTTMAASGISKPALKRLACQLHCFIADEDVAEAAKQQDTTRSAISMEKSLQLQGEKIYVIGNAPTALLKLEELILAGKLKPALIIAVPVGFVQVVESKEAIMALDVPWMVARGRQGGSNIAAAMMNALLYELYRRED